MDAPSVTRSSVTRRGRAYFTGGNEGVELQTKRGLILIGSTRPANSRASSPIGSVTVLFRPELRFERAYDTLVYDNGARKNQLMFACDVILFF